MKYEEFKEETVKALREFYGGGTDVELVDVIMGTGVMPSVSVPMEGTAVRFPPFILKGFSGCMMQGIWTWGDA